MVNLSTNILICLVFFLLSYLAYRQRHNGIEFKAFFMLVTLFDIAAVSLLLGNPIDEGRVRACAPIGYILNMLYLLSLTFASYYWMIYAEYVEKSEFSLSRKKRAIASVPAVVISVLCLSAPWNHLIFSVNEYGQYIRGPWFILQFVISYLYVAHILVRAAYVLLKLNPDNPRELKVFLLFVTIAVVFGIAQALWGGSFVMMGMCIGALCIYTNLTAVRAEEVRQAETIRKINLELEHQVDVQTEKIRKSNEIIIETLGSIVEDRNMESGTHIKRVKQYTEVIARRMAEMYPKYGMDDHQVRVITSASALHDIGKIAISDTVLLKPGKFTPEEFKLMQAHTTMGYEMLRKIKGAWEPEYEETSCLIAKYHHERYDGKGYPEHLKGDEIPICAQIVSVADVFDALVTDRVYKPAFSTKKALEMILAGECGQFSPEILRCVQDMFPQLQEIARGLRG